MNETISRQLLSLLRCAIWNEKPEPGLLGKDTEWDKIAALAYKQSVLGVMAEGIKGVDKELQPSGDFMMRIYGYTVKTNNYHHLLNSVIEELCGKLKDEGIHCVLLKGQGLAANYPNPLSRSCGDIDLYVGSSNYKKACDLTKEWGMQKEDAEESYQHLHFKYRGVDVEIHRITGVIYNPLYNFRFRRWSDMLLKSYTGREITFGTQSVCLPPVRFDSLYIFYHLYRHLITGGVGLRQLTDCALYLHKFRNEIDKEVLLNDLRSFGLLRSWQIYGSIAVRYIGLPENEFPLYRESDDIISSADFIFNEIVLSYGNFGFFDPNRKKRPDGFLTGKLYSLKVKMAFISKFRKAFGNQILFFVPFYLWRGVNNVITHKDNFRKK